MVAYDGHRPVGQVKEVTSLANPLVKDIKALALKKFRDQQNAFMAEGLKLVIDALDLGWSIRTLVFAKAGRGNAAVEKVAARTVAAGGTVLEVSEKVLAAMGSIFAVPVAKATEQAFLAWRRDFPGLVAGTHLKGAVDYRSVDFSRGPVLLLMGNEQQGLPDSLAESCDRLLRIPQAGRADSLNLAVATGVMLFEIRRGALKLDPATDTR